MKTISKTLFILLAILSVSCDDIMEEDITDDNITTIDPQNNAQIESNAVAFQWSNLKGADKYRIQVYSSSQSMVLDSLVSGNRFTYALNPGAYQWRIRGENFAYQTAYTFPLNFTLSETDDLSLQILQLLTPNPGLYTNNASLNFTWSPINAAQHYEFQLLNMTNGGSTVYSENAYTNTSLSLNSNTINTDAVYQWKVKAVNTENNTETNFSSRNFSLDTTAPNQPVAIAPANESTNTVNDELTFEWTAPTDSGPVSSALSYTIQISSTQNFSTVIFTDTTNFDYYDYTFSATGNYYWRIRATDAANNTGSYSAPFKIVIQ